MTTPSSVISRPSSASSSSPAPPKREMTGRGILALIVGWLAMLAFTFYACTHMVAAGDTWVAMACGRHFVHHGVNTVEPFSANSHKAGPTPEEVEAWPKWAQWITAKVGLETVKKWHPTGWINQNWLTHVIFYELTTMLGSEEKPYFDALVFWKFAVYVLVVACLYFTSRLLGVNRALAVAFACVAMLVGRSFLDVRPAGFSNLLVPTFLLVLALTVYRNALYVWLIVPLIVFWANVHGGYVYAFLMLVPFVGWHLIMRLPRRWSVAAYCILAWLVMAGLAHQLTKHEFFVLGPKSMWRDWVVYLFVVAAAGSAALTYSRQVSEKALIAFHVAASFILFVLYLTRFLPQEPTGLSAYGRELFATDIGGARVAFVGIFALAMFIGMAVLFLGNRIIRVMEPRAILHTVAAGAVAFVAMVIYNPFHLTNLTHTFVISVSSAAARWREVHEWQRAFDWTNVVGTEIPFLMMYILAWACLAIWAVVLVRNDQLTSQLAKRKRPQGRDSKAQRNRLAAPQGEYVWPKMDVALLVIAGMTVYMAIRSRRFIPIAAYAACPVLGLLVQESLGRLLAMMSARRAARLELPELTRSVYEASLVGLAAAVVVFALVYLLLHWWLFTPIAESDKVVPNVALVLVWVGSVVLAFLCSVVLYSSLKWPRAAPGGTAGGDLPIKSALVTASILLCGSIVGFSTYVGWKFNDVYLSYWPADPVLTSVFMRMTASDSKPFGACQFIRDNKLSGNMFNYWTEGGFIAWGQTPDPNTGRTPLQLFMDGRAQAAYDRSIFDRWTEILTGGPAAIQAAKEGRATLKPNEIVQVGQWLSSELQKYNVWVVLMPGAQFFTPFVHGLESSPNWATVFTTNKEMLFVDVRTPQGRQLYDNVMAGKAVYPDEFSADMAMGHNLLLSSAPEQRKRGFDLALKAFKRNPSPAPVMDLWQFVTPTRCPDLQGEVNQARLDFVTDFQDNKATYAGHDGYNLRLEAARLCLVYLADIAGHEGNQQAARTYTDRIDRYAKERDHIADTKRW